MLLALSLLLLLNISVSLSFIAKKGFYHQHSRFINTISSLSKQKSIPPTYIHTNVNDDGIYELPNGDVYEGWMIKDGDKDIRQGNGRCVYRDGRLFIGEFSNDQEKIGTMTYPNGDIYNGEFLDGLRDGLGVMTSANGSYIYEGRWCHDKKHGIAKLRNRENIWIGRFFDDKMTGGLFGGFFHANN